MGEAEDASPTPIRSCFGGLEPGVRTGEAQSHCKSGPAGGLEASGSVTPEKQRRLQPLSRGGGGCPWALWGPRQTSDMDPAGPMHRRSPRSYHTPLEGGLQGEVGTGWGSGWQLALLEEQ